MDLCIFDPVALCGHSDTTRLSVLWQRRESPCTCPEWPHTSPRPGSLRTKGSPGSIIWVRLLGEMTQRAWGRVMSWIVQTSNFQTLYFLAACLLFLRWGYPRQEGGWVTLGGPGQMLKKPYAQKYACPRQVSCNSSWMSSEREYVGVSTGAHLNRIVTP